MEPATKKLRPYQVRLVTDVGRATEDVLVEQPSGSGKTVQIVTPVAMHLGRRFSHAVGMSLGDRACLALALHSGLPALTTEDRGANAAFPLDRSFAREGEARE